MLRDRTTSHFQVNCCPLHPSIAIGRLPCSPLSSQQPSRVNHASQYPSYTGSGGSIYSQGGTSVTIGAGIPPIPAKLVQRIEAGNFIEMGELLLERLQITNINTDIEGTISSKAKYKSATNIIDWTQCFGLYVAVLSCSQPESG